MCSGMFVQQACVYNLLCFVYFDCFVVVLFVWLGGCFVCCLFVVPTFQLYWMDLPTSNVVYIYNRIFLSRLLWLTFLNWCFVCVVCFIGVFCWRLSTFGTCWFRTQIALSPFGNVGLVAFRIITHVKRYYIHISRNSVNNELLLLLSIYLFHKSTN